MKKVLVILITLTLVLTGCGKKEEKTNNVVESNQEDKTGPKSFEKHDIDGLSISNFNINTDGGSTNLYANIKNIEKDNMYVKLVYVYLYDKDDNLIVDTLFYVDSTLKPGVENTYQSEISSAVTGVTRVEFKVEK